MAASVRESHMPVAGPSRYFSRIRACWIWVARAASILCCPWRFQAPFLLRRWRLELLPWTAFELALVFDFVVVCFGEEAAAGREPRMSATIAVAIRKARIGECR